MPRAGGWSGASRPAGALGAWRCVDLSRARDVKSPDAPPLPDAASERPRLLRAMGRSDLTASVVNSVVGSSIFAMPALIAGLTGAWSPLAFLAGGLGMLTIVLCHAEVASRFT